MIPGFDLAVATMSLKEKASFFIPAAMAYGAEGKAQLVPPGSNLVFDIQVLGIDGNY